MVPKLFDICLQMVAKNINHVESLVGFPDVVGKQIFHAAETANQFDLENFKGSRYAVSLFASAYTDQLLCSLNIEGEHLMLANSLEHLMLFYHLKELDISSCGLGDEHELLYHIATLESLEVLLLRNNSLTDRGIQKWTAPIRVKKTGPTGLKILDLSENDSISTRSLRFLHVFCCLQLLNLSNTAIQQKQAQDLKDFAERRSLLIKTSLTEKQCADLTHRMLVKTRGWAKEVIHRWIKQARQPLGQKSQPGANASTKASRFYGRGQREAHLKTSSPAAPRLKRSREPSTHLSLVLVSNCLMSRNQASEPLSSREPITLRGLSGGLESISSSSKSTAYPSAACQLTDSQSTVSLSPSSQFTQSQVGAGSSGQSSRLKLECGGLCHGVVSENNCQFVNPGQIVNVSSLIEASVDCQGSKRRKTYHTETCVKERSRGSHAMVSLGVCSTKKQTDLSQVSRVVSLRRKDPNTNGQALTETKKAILCDRVLSQEEALLLSQYASV